MQCRKKPVAIALFSVVMVSGLAITPVGAQSSRRGYSTRGMSPVGSPVGASMGMTRPSYNRPNYVTRSTPVNPNAGSYNSGPTFDLGSYAPYMGAYDMAAWGNQFMPVDGSPMNSELTSGMRPSIRPRLDIEQPDVVNSSRVLKGIRDAVVEQIEQCAERPFSEQWYTAHASLTPLRTESGGAWHGSNWESLKNWVGLTEEPQSYDFRPDETGLIFVYRNQQRLGRAVDARRSALELAGTQNSSSDALSSLSLGVFAEVSPIDQPVKSLLHLAVGKSGTLSGYRYDFATDAAIPLQGAYEPASQSIAWGVGSDVMQTGLENLTRDVTRALLFRDDGWTQSWILMRISEPTPTGADTQAADQVDPAVKPDPQ